MIQMRNEIVLVRYLLCCLAAGSVGCGGSDVYDGQPSTHPPTMQVAPNLPITKVVEVDAGSDAQKVIDTNTQWAEMCYWQQGKNVFARHAFPGLDPALIATHVRVYEALDIPVEVSVPLVSYGEAWYDCGLVGKSTPMIIFSWVE